MKDLWQTFVIPYMSRLLRSQKRTILFLPIVKKSSMNSQNKVKTVEGIDDSTVLFF